jgi:hypothetical protein
MKTKAVADVTLYWKEPPPEPSPRLLEWLDRLKSGWCPNKRVRTLGYHEAAKFFGVYIWEYLRVLQPVLYKSWGLKYLDKEWVTAHGLWPSRPAGQSPYAARP